MSKNPEADAFNATVEKFGLDPEAAYDKDKSERPIPLEWRDEILDFHINTLKEYIEYINKNNQDRNIDIALKNRDDLEDFEMKFHSTLLKNISTFIRDIKKEIPKKYYRGLVLETTAQGFLFNIKY
jgi:hypothetical protein